MSENKTIARKVRKFAKVAIIVMLLIYLLDNYVFVNGTWRYRITVEVDTPEGVKTGSAVREVTVRRGIQLLPEQGAVVEVSGEAVVVDLGARGVLFALITGDDGGSLPARVFYPKRAWLAPEGIRYMNRLESARKTLEPKHYPSLVYFKNIQDPMTVFGAVDKNECLTGRSECPKGKNVYTMERAFGAGVQLKSISVEMTKDDINPRIDKFLPWLQSVKMSYLTGRGTSIGSPMGLTGGEFQKGDVNGR